MHFAVYVPLLAPLLLLPCLRLLAPQLHPRFASWLLMITMVALGLGSTASLAILTAAGLVKLPVAQLTGRWSAELLAQYDAVGLPVGVGAAAGLAGSVVACGYTLARWARALNRARRELGEVAGDAAFTVVPDDTPYAYTLPGSRGKIVVSSGMLRALTTAERRALLAHERAHLESRHDLIHCLAMLAVRLNPLLVPLRATLSYTIERWADESAVRDTGDRPAAARAIGKAALAARAGSRPPVGSLAAAAGPVPRRVQALLRPAPVLGLRGLLRSFVGVICAGTIVMVVGSGLATVEAASDLNRALETSEVAG